MYDQALMLLAIMAPGVASIIACAFLHYRIAHLDSTSRRLVHDSYHFEETMKALTIILKEVAAGQKKAPAKPPIKRAVKSPIKPAVKSPIKPAVKPPIKSAKNGAKNANS